MLLLVCSLTVIGIVQSQDTPVYPDGSIRLVGGRNPTEGNVEVFYRGRWGSICDDEWDIREAYIVCKMLGYNRAVRATFNSQFGRGRGECKILLCLFIFVRLNLYYIREIFTHAYISFGCQSCLNAICISQCVILSKTRPI